MKSFKEFLKKYLVEDYPKLAEEKINSIDPSPFDVRDNISDLISDEDIHYRIYLCYDRGRFYSLYASNGSKFGTSQDNDCGFKLDYLIYPSKELLNNMDQFMNGEIYYDIRIDPIYPTRNINPIFLGSDGTIDNDNIISSNLSRLKGMYSNYDVRISNLFVNNGEVTYYIYL